MRTNILTDLTTSAFLSASGSDMLPAVEAFAKQYKRMGDVWANCPRPDWMLYILDKINESPEETDIRLFACWCARNTPIGGGRTTWDLLTDPRSRTAIEVSERYAVGNATKEERYTAYLAAWTVADAEGSTASEKAAAWTVDTSMSPDVAEKVSYSAAWAAAYASHAAETFMTLAHIAQANQLRTVVRNPFIKR